MSTVIHLSQNSGIRNSSNYRLPEDHLINSAWNFTYTTLWYGKRFTDKEIRGAKKAIKEILLSGVDMKAAFIRLCQQVLIAQRNTTSSVLPSIWLSPYFNDGYYAVDSIYRAMLAQRRLIPNYGESIKAVSECYWKYIHYRSDRTLSRCRQLLIRNQEPQLMALLSNAIVHNSIA